MNQSNTMNFEGLRRQGLIGAPLAVMALLAMIVVPLPPLLLDIFFTFSIALSLVVLLSTMYTKRPLDFSVFPTILLVATLFRLALNIASTRVVLLEGHTGTGAAGKVISSFGEFVVGGNYAVGFVVFSILVIINFVVVTKGAGRISEVSARFTLDSMPGKQMAIDADLNAGTIDHEEAKNRRAEVVIESDFYGSMDGASKFVRGDAVAGILIMVINIVGGLSIGLMQHDMAFNDAVRNYTLLTIGDGLVAQIPSLVLSTGSAIMVTRVSSEGTMGNQIFSQTFNSPRILAVTAIIMGSMGVIPGMPNVAFLSIALAAGVGSYFLANQQTAEQSEPEDEEIKAPEPEPPTELGWDDVVPIDTIGLEVGYRLIPMVDRSQGGELMTRIKGVRKKLTQELGLLVPSVHIKDNLELSPNAYRITLKGVVVGESEIYPEQDFAINPGQVFGNLKGVPAKDPAFGLEALWVDSGQRDMAQSMGYTVVDSSTVVATHLSQILQNNSHELLGIEETQELLDNLEKRAPKLVANLVPDTLPLSVVHKVLQNLLEEGVSIRDMKTIVEILAEGAARTQDPAFLTTAVRGGLGRSIVQKLSGDKQHIEVVTLDPALEHILQESIQANEKGGLGVEPGLAERLHQSLSEIAQRQEATGEQSILVVSAPIRHMLAQFVRRSIKNMSVLSFNEIPDNKQIKVISSIGNDG